MIDSRMIVLAGESDRRNAVTECSETLGRGHRNPALSPTKFTHGKRDENGAPAGS